LAATLKQDPDTQVEVVEGERGELTVLVDGREVIRKGDSLPSVEEVRAAVEGAHAGA
jgi:hypothetical protein